MSRTVKDYGDARLGTYLVNVRQEANPPGQVPDEEWPRFLDWSVINRFVAVEPRYIYEPIEKMYLVDAAIISNNLDEVKFLNATLRESYALLPYSLRLSLRQAFEERPKLNFLPVEIACTKSLDMLRYVVEHCCPSGYDVLDMDPNRKPSPMLAIIRSGKVDILDYILSHAPRGLEMLNDLHDGRHYWEYTQEFLEDGEMEEYLATVVTTFLGRESERIHQALEDLEAAGYELPALMLGVIRDNTEAIRYRERLAGN